MTLSEKCKLWIEACYKEHLTDVTFDELSYILAKRYTKLPKWFTKQVPLESLEAGTSLGTSFRKNLPDIFKV
jgi:hypothetical protein